MKYKLLILFLLATTGVMGQAWSTSPAVTTQTRIVSGSGQIRWLWGSTGIVNFHDTLQLKYFKLSPTAVQTVGGTVTPGSGTTYLTRLNTIGTSTADNQTIYQLFVDAPLLGGHASTAYGIGSSGTSLFQKNLITLGVVEARTFGTLRDTSSLEHKQRWVFDTLGTRQVRMILHGKSGNLSIARHDTTDVADTSSLLVAGNIYLPHVGTGTSVSGLGVTSTGKIITTSGGGGSYLQIPNNLSDVASMQFTRQNIGFQAIWGRRGVSILPSIAADQNNVGEPNMIRDINPQIITTADTVYKAVFTGGYGAPNIYYAESIDGVNWVRYASAIITNHDRPFFKKFGSTYYVYCANLANTQLDQYTSTGAPGSFTLAHSAVVTASALSLGAVYSCDILIESGTWKMWLECNNGNEVVYYLTSSDGITWAQGATNPIIATYTGGNPQVYKIGSTYWLWGHGTGIVGGVVPSDIYRQSSSDGIHFGSAIKVFPRRQFDEGPDLPNGGVSDIAILPVGGSVYMWYTATTDETVGNGHIKLAVTPMTMAQLVTTTEGDGGDITVLPPFFNVNPTTLQLGYTGSSGATVILDAPGSTAGAGIQFNRSGSSKFNISIDQNSLGHEDLSIGANVSPGSISFNPGTDGVINNGTYTQVGSSQFIGHAVFGPALGDVLVAPYTTGSGTSTPGAMLYQQAGAFAWGTANHREIYGVTGSHWHDVVNFSNYTQSWARFRNGAESDIVMSLVYDNGVSNNVSLIMDEGGGAPFTADANLLVDIRSTTKGVAWPRMTTTQRTAISVPTEGEIVYDVTLHSYYFWTGSAWVATGSSGGPPVTSVSGTTNRITSTGGTTPVIDISSTFEALLGKVANRIDQNNASTTSAQLAGVLSDESGSGVVAYTVNPVFTTPNLGTPSTLVGTNITGAAAGFTAGNVTTNANLTGPITSVGNATTITSSVALPGSPTTTTQTTNDNSTKLATTAYVDNAILGQDLKEAVKYATTAALPSLIYSNGSSGVGATLTGVGFGAITIDGATPSVGDRLLIKNQVTTFQNGIYTVTIVGAVSTAFVLTRSTDFNQSAEIKTGSSTFATAGTANASTTWAVNSADSPVMGTDAITFTQVAGPGSQTLQTVATAGNSFSGQIQANSFAIIGTAGAGFVDIATQSTDPSTPASGHNIIFADASGRFSVKGSNGFDWTVSKSLLTANRIQLVPDSAGTYALESRLIPDASISSATNWNTAYNARITSASIVWPGTIFTTPTTGVIASQALTFSPALATQTANAGLYGPVSGGAATPTFRAQVIADLPTNIPSANLANGGSEDLKAIQDLGSVAVGWTPGYVIPTSAAQVLNNQAIRIGIVRIPKAVTLTGLKIMITVSGVYTSSGYNGVGLYTVNTATGNMTLVASSTTSTTIWTGLGLITVPFSSTYAAAAGTYIIAALYQRSAETTPPSISVAAINSASGLDFPNSIKVAGTFTGQSTLPSTPAMSSFAATGAMVWGYAY